MLSLSSAQRYFLYDGKTDMRKGFDSLCGIVREQFKMNPLSGDVFIFLSRTRTRIKLLQWQGDGYAMYFKRLEKGSFEMPDDFRSLSTVQLSSSQLHLIMEGILLSSVTKCTRYSHSIVGNSPMKNASASVM
ncbi:MAG: IS66 family insertion sequence element accessory protein TnpB [Bacteroidota bacterium]|nr:IS66 family insertion sequence element accessory protein TnpB [Bacteroidota bacterium]